MVLILHQAFFSVFANKINTFKRHFIYSSVSPVHLRPFNCTRIGGYGPCVVLQVISLTSSLFLVVCSTNKYL